MGDLTQRLKGISNRQTLKLTHYGRKTGNPYQVTIWFAVDGDTMYLATANVNRQWVRNVKKTPAVKLAIGTATFEGKARFVDSTVERSQVLGIFKRKYWMFLPFLLLGQILSSIGVTKDTTGAFVVTLAQSA